MKRSEIATIILVAGLSIVVAYFVADAIIGKPSNGKVTVKTTAPITADITEPDSKIFNHDAINPTVEVVIGDE